MRRIKIKKKYIIFLSLIIFFLLPFVQPSLLESGIELSLPVIDNDYHWKTLEEISSKELSDRFDSFIFEDEILSDLVKKKKFALGLVDLSDIYNPVAAWINGREMMYAASLPKIAILFAAMQALENGAIDDTPEIIGDLYSMIRNSDNEAATRMIDRLTLQKIEEALLSPDFRFFDNDRGGGLWVGKRYARQGEKHPDPINGLSHGANAYQVCRFYYLLATGSLLSPGRSKQMLDILSRPALCHKFVKVLSKKFPLDRIYRKSGTWKCWHSDSVLVWGSSGKPRYILVSLVEHPDGERILRAVASFIQRVLSDSERS